MRSLTLKKLFKSKKEKKPESEAPQIKETKSTSSTRARFGSLTAAFRRLSRLVSTFLASCALPAYGEYKLTFDLVAKPYSRRVDH